MYYLLQVSWQPRHNQQLSRSHVVDLYHVSYHRIWRYGPKHILWERSLPPDGHYGERSCEKQTEYSRVCLCQFVKVLKGWQPLTSFIIYKTNMLQIFYDGKNCWQASEISKNPHCASVSVCSCSFTGCWLHCLGGGCGGKETGINQSGKTCP